MQACISRTELPTETLENDSRAYDGLNLEPPREDIPHPLRELEALVIAQSGLFAGVAIGWDSTQVRKQFTIRAIAAFAAVPGVAVLADQSWLRHRLMVRHPFCLRGSRGLDRLSSFALNKADCVCYPIALLVDADGNIADCSSRSERRHCHKEVWKAMHLHSESGSN